MTIHQSNRPGSAHTYFETPRLRARGFVAADTEAFAAYRADPDVKRYQSWSGSSVEEARSLIDSMNDAEPGAPGQWYQFALECRASGALVGDVALSVDAMDPTQGEIGFTLAPEHHGKGYATEAVKGLLDFSFGKLRLRRIVGVTDALNHAAASLLLRVGMRREAYFHENVFFKGAWGSEFVFASLHREWAESCEEPRHSTESGQCSADG